MKVTHNAVHELLGIVVTQNATRGIVVNAGEFTQAARQAAANSGERIELVDGVALRAMLGDAVPPASLAIANPFVGGMGGLRRAHRAWWKAKLFGTAVSIGLALVVGVLAWSLFQQAIGTLPPRVTQRAEAPTQSSPSAQSPPRSSRMHTASPARAPVLSREERTMRRELVRTTARGLNGVTSAVWLSDRALFLGMGPSTPNMRSSAAIEACALLARYPELPQTVEVQQTSGASNGDVARIACAGGSPRAAYAPPARQAPPPAPPPPEIVMYGSPNCTYCRQAEAYFARRGLAYRNVDITASRQAHAEFLRLGGRGTPLILIDGRRIHGFSAARLDAALRRSRG